MVVEVRAAERGDLPAVLDVVEIVDPPDEGADVDDGYYEHLLDIGGLVVAEAGGIVIGYAGRIQIERTAHLSDLFVHPDAHGQGIGSALLAAVWPAPVGELPRQTFASLHPAALPLYIRAGMAPRWPLLYLRGDPRSLPGSPFRVRDAGGGELADLELDWIGWDRSVEFRFWATRPGARAVVVSDGDAAVAVAVVTRTRALHSIAHLAVADASCAADALAALGPICGTDLMLAAPGANRVVPMLVDLGWRIVDRDLYCASEADLWPPALVLPHPGFV